MKDINEMTDDELEIESLRIELKFRLQELEFLKAQTRKENAIAKQTEVLVDSMIKVQSI